MKVNVQTPNFSVKDELLIFVEKKLAKLEQFHPKIVFADVFLKVQGTSEKEDKAVEVLLSVPGEDIMVKKEAKTFEEAIMVLREHLNDSLRNEDKNKKHICSRIF